MAARDKIASPRVKWKTPSMSDERIVEIAAALEALAGNVSCYAGGGSYAHRLRGIASEIEDGGIAPMR